MKKLQNLSIYITNVCNLNCNNCNYLNNYAFSGHQRWNDHKETYHQWASRLDIGIIHLLGGEPMANPDFLDWVHGIANLWPLAVIKINTNGTMFDRWPTLYQELLPYSGRVYLAISGHNADEKNNQLDLIERFLSGPLERITGSQKIFEIWHWNRCYQQIKDPSWPDCKNLQDYQNLPSDIRDEIENILHININDYIMEPEPFKNGITMIDHNGMRCCWSEWWEFMPAAIIHDQVRNTLSLTHSDPQKSLEMCAMKTCHMLSDGKLFKCPISYALPEFIKQFPVSMSDSDKKIIESYRPAQVDWDDKDLEEFLHNLLDEKVIDMCQFCPSSAATETIKASNKKIKIKKLSQ